LEKVKEELAASQQQVAEARQAASDMASTWRVAEQRVKERGQIIVDKNKYIRDLLKKPQASQQQVAEARQVAETNVIAARDDHVRWLASQQRNTDLQALNAEHSKLNGKLSVQLTDAQQQNGRLRIALIRVEGHSQDQYAQEIARAALQEPEDHIGEATGMIAEQDTASEE
jgi:hypothetical protein